MTHHARPHEKPRIGITLGDVNGIGPEVVMKALGDARILSLITPVVYGSTRVLSFYKKLLALEEFNFSQVKGKGQLVHKSINVVNCWEEPLDVNPGKATRETGAASLKALQEACSELKEGLIDALVTAPIDKHSIHSEEFPFKGHTEFLAREFGGGESLMFMVSESLRVGLVTDHEALRDVPALITRERVEAKLQLMERSLKRDFGISKPRIAVLGLNPHAGDGGLIGREDEEIIRPVVSEARNKGRLVSGPLPSDGFFGTAQYRQYDGVLAMYHDQGLVPFKTLAFESGVNYTGGLSIVRTSPDHGTAYNIAGKNQANEASMRQAIFLAGEIFRHHDDQSKEK
ncbi:MAG TPA: 4-hydroxythreonine-4-phosphate dehydrogenase PdxA [Chryseosolibacter sp.]|nr:4-hydroxythreonine-4-phosphate dehydrogenase PdxA [Chryseosolibacter sp.]